jgi:hypothetical protein
MIAATGFIGAQMGESGSEHFPNRPYTSRAASGTTSGSDATAMMAKNHSVTAGVNAIRNGRRADGRRDQRDVREQGAISICNAVVY